MVVLDPKRIKLLHLYIFGYGTPTIIVVITLAGAFIQDSISDKFQYLHPELCWLNEGYVWAAFCPAIIMLIFNGYVLIKVLRIFWRQVIQIIKYLYHKILLQYVFTFPILDCSPKEFSI